MKKNTIAAVTAAALLVAAFALSGCDTMGDKTDPISARETMEGFVDTVNAGDLGNLKQFLHTDALQRSQAGSADFWGTTFFDGFSFNSPVMSGNNATVTGTGDETFTFTLAEDDPDQYKITTINDESGPVFQ